VRRLGAAVAARPATLATALAVLVVGIALARLNASDYQRVVQRVAVTPAALRELRLWTLIAATLVQADPGLRVRFFTMLAFVVGSLALLEGRVGSLRVVLVFFGAEFVVGPGRLVALALLDRVDVAEARRLLNVGDSGSSAAVLAVISAYVMLWPRRRAVVGFAVLAVWLVATSVPYRFDVELVHVIGVGFGVCVGEGLRCARTHPAPS